MKVWYAWTPDRREVFLEKPWHYIKSEKPDRLFPVTFWWYRDVENAVPIKLTHEKEKQLLEEYPFSKLRDELGFLFLIEVDEKDIIYITE